MLFSIIVPVYNVKNYIEECLQSIIFQAIDFPLGAEIILVDDGSTDGSGEICNRYWIKYPEIIKVVHQENQGLLLARRRGFREAKGEYIINCDSDDKLSQNCLHELSSVISKFGTDVVFYNVMAFEPGRESQWTTNIFSNNLCEIVDSAQVLDNYLLTYECVSMWCKTFKRRCLDFNLDYSEYRRLNMGEDTLQSAEIYSHASTYSYLNKTLYYYRCAVGMTSKFVEDYYFQFKQVCKIIEKTEKIAQINDFDKKMAVKVFGIAARSITQGRKDRRYSYSAEKEYLKAIREDELVQKYAQLYGDIKFKLQRSHRVLCGMLLKRFYLGIWLMIKLYNLVS